jgi:hypothetical protein
MARHLSAYLKRVDVPSRAALQGAIKALKLPLVLDEEYAPFADTAYVPCALDGEDAGFDLRFKDTPADLSATPSVQSGIEGRDTLMAFKWGGDPREDAAASIVCAALATAFGAIVQDGDKDALIGADKLISRAKANLE